MSLFDDATGFVGAIGQLMQAVLERQEELLDLSDIELASRLTGYFGPTVEIGGHVSQLSHPPTHVWPCRERNANYIIELTVTRDPNEDECEELDRRYGNPNERNGT